mmetsp:Transcript_30762/g.92242  ORF Transcript_30762/g.92242 Transcript_30762/m.92242 type:complete len:213 (-) Transcript_30762:41-679(-)
MTSNLCAGRARPNLAKISTGWVAGRVRGRVAATPRLPRGYSEEMGRGDAAAPESDRPRRRDARGRKRHWDVWAGLSTPPRLPRGYSVATGRGDTRRVYPRAIEDRRPPRIRRKTSPDGVGGSDRGAVASRRARRNFISKAPSSSVPRVDEAPRALAPQNIHPRERQRARVPVHERAARRAARKQRHALDAGAAAQIQDAAAPRRVRREVGEF